MYLYAQTKTVNKWLANRLRHIQDSTHFILVSVSNFKVKIKIKVWSSYFSIFLFNDNSHLFLVASRVYISRLLRG